MKYKNGEVQAELMEVAVPSAGDAVRKQTREEKYLESCSGVARELLEMMKAAGPYEMPWGKGLQLPRNRLNGRIYTGNNLLLLGYRCMRHNYSTNVWATLYQWRQVGGRVRKGQKGTLVAITFRKGKIRNAEQTQLDPQWVEGQTTKSKLRTSYVYVFNRDQVDGIDPDQTELFPFVDLLQKRDVEDFVRRLGLRVLHLGNRAYYTDTTDRITMPPLMRFMNLGMVSAIHHYQATLLHEIVHWTGHAKRCDRNLTAPFGSKAYAFEELVAEFGAAFLCAHFDRVPVKRAQHAAYLNSWAQLLSKRRHLLKAAMNQGAYAAMWALGTAYPGSLDLNTYWNPKLEEQDLAWLRQP